MSKPPPILLVEDEEHDVLFMQIALEQAQADHPLVVARDGQEAIRYLKDTEFGNRREHPLPCLVLLDLRLPRVPGLDVLKWIRCQPAFVQLPVLIHSSSNQDRDVERAYAAGANGYIVKPTSLAELFENVRRIKKYWLDQNGPPPNCQDWLSITVPHRVPP